MDTIERTIEARWRHRILFTDQLFDPANPVLEEAMQFGGAGGNLRALVVVDESLASAQPSLIDSIRKYFEARSGRLELVSEPMIVEGGEQAKNSASDLSRLQSAISRHHIDRHSFVVAVGGGALLDLAGFAAATAHRGVRHVRVPTTTLSQCDSGVGVKNGINAFGKKNFIGTFAPPFAVINDFRMLRSLATRDLRAGYAEAVKVACIRDAAFFGWIENAAHALSEFEPAAMRQLIRRCAELHVNHIADGGDPFETGSTRPLDFGHWTAHKLEQLSDFRLRHGEAVAVGIALDVCYAKRLGCLEAAQAERILRLLEALGFELFAPELLHAGPEKNLLVLDGLNEFREHLGGQLAIPMLSEIGTSFETHEMTLPLVVEAIETLQSRCARRHRNQAIACR